MHPTAGVDLGFIAPPLYVTAGVWAVAALAIAFWYVRSPKRSAVVTYWIAVCWVLAVNWIFVRFDSDTDLHGWRTAMGWLHPDDTWDNIDSIARLNVVTPFALVLFFAAPLFRRYWRSRQRQPVDS